MAAEPIVSTEPDVPAVMTEEAVKELAKNLVTNRVFMSDRIRRFEEIPMVFLAFALSGPEIGEQYKKEQIVHLYEFFDKAMQRGFNGYPIFTSHFAINKTDYARVIDAEMRMRKALEGA